MTSRMSVALATIILVIASEGAALAGEHGIASSYPYSYKGRRTASGEALDPRAMTCAHRRYPFGSTLRVTAGEKSITCRVTDRGPFVRGRVIDLTPAAAHALGVTGLTHVSVERM